MTAPGGKQRYYSIIDQYKKVAVQWDEKPWKECCTDKTRIVFRGPMKEVAKCIAELHRWCECDKTDADQGWTT